MQTDKIITVRKLSKVIFAESQYSSFSQNFNFMCQFFFKYIMNKVHVVVAFR